MSERWPEPTTPMPGAGCGELSARAQLHLVRALRRACVQAQDGPVTLIETHISFVLLCGDVAYKFKKAIRTAFLDQSTRALRLHACEEELRLNRRLAPDLYLSVATITGEPAAPVIGGDGPPIDHAVKMRAFAQADLWAALAARGALGPAQIDELAALLAPFHAQAAVASPNGRLGSAEQVRATVLQNLNELAALATAPVEHDALQCLRAWEAQVYPALLPKMAQRLTQGRVRECHGDLHLGNVTMVDGRTTVFDGIEFSDEFRWIDVMGDIAFMAMDLHAHGLAPLAHRFVNAYLESSGDHDGLAVLRYYLVHRALVRAKVSQLRVAQCGAQRPHDAGIARHDAARYLALAQQFSQPTAPMLMLTHGCSGSGKSTLTKALLEELGAVRIRSDVERRRLLDQASGHADDGCSAGLRPNDRYGPAMNAGTHERLRQLARQVLSAGHHVIVDATFVRRDDRDRMRRVAEGLQRRCVILDFTIGADLALMRERVRQRSVQGGDVSEADEAVLDRQLQTIEPLGEDELVLAVPCWRRSAAAVARSLNDVESTVSVPGRSQALIPECAARRVVP
ncbi:MAG: AAA family ATPase [Ideonella sp.]|nr:AAA family ATPase [Ideonella sp.]